jgi:hypothetical protein
MIKFIFKIVIVWFLAVFFWKYVWEMVLNKGVNDYVWNIDRYNYLANKLDD